MLHILLVVAGLAGSVLSSGPSKCDDDVIANIKCLWNGTEPRNIIKDARNNGKEEVVGTTKDYYPDDVNSTFSYFVKERCNSMTRVDMYEVQKNGTLKSKATYVKEESGTTYDPKTKLRRYHVYQDCKGGVTAFYACYESDTAECGIPAGLVKRRSYDYDEDSLQKGIKLLLDVGVVITKFYNVSSLAVK